MGQRPVAVAVAVAVNVNVNVNDRTRATAHCSSVRSILKPSPSDGNSLSKDGAISIAYTITKLSDAF